MALKRSSGDGQRLRVEELHLRTELRDRGRQLVADAHHVADGRFGAIATFIARKFAADGL